MSEIKADINALEAEVVSEVAAEAEEKGFTTVIVEYDGEYYEIPEEARNWPLEVMDAQEDGRNIGMIKGLLGDDQYRTFRSKPRTMGDFEDFSNKLVKAGVKGK